jgi:glycosyltransferase involved in cell wall biosynthesis
VLTDQHHGSPEVRVFHHGHRDEQRTGGEVVHGDHYYPNSPALIPWLEAQGVPEEKITVIPNGVDVDKYDIEIDEEVKRDELGLPRDAFVVGSVGRLHEQKGFDTLLEAAADLDVHVYIAGEGPERDRLEQLAEDLGISERVHLPGNRDDVPELLQVFDVFCFPSHYEGMSNALLEAMAAGCCCVVSDIDENTVLLTDKEDGRTFTTGDVASLTAVLRDVYEDCDYGKNAVETVKNQFSIEANIKNYRSIIEELG